MRILNMKKTETESAGKAASMVLTAMVEVDNARADGATFNRIVYTLMDGQTPVAGQYVTFTAFSDSNGAQLSSAYAKTNASGSVVLEVTNTAVETVLIRAESAASTFDTVSVEINFVAVETSYTLESIITVNNAAADGVSENKVMFILQDTLGKPVPRKLLEFIPSTGLSLSDKYKETDDNGTAVIGCSTLQMGSYIINAVVYGEETTHRVAGLSFIEGDALDALTGIVIKDNAGGDGEDYCEIQYRLTKKTARDVIANQKITLELNSASAFLDESTVITDYAGIAIARLYNTEEEAVIVSAHTADNKLSTRNTVNFSFVSKPSMTYEGTAKYAGNYGIDSIVPRYDFTAGHRYQFIIQMDGTVHVCGPNKIRVKNTCASKPQPADGATFEFPGFDFVNGSREYTCATSGTTLYEVLYFYLESGQHYSVTINDLSV
jgi:hypothetical protein